MQRNVDGYAQALSCARVRLRALFHYQWHPGEDTRFTLLLATPSRTNCPFPSLPLPLSLSRLNLCLFIGHERAPRQNRLLQGYPRVSDMYVV